MAISSFVMVIFSIDGVPPKLSGFVRAFHPAAPGSNSKHTIYAFINLNLSYNILKRRS